MKIILGESWRVSIQPAQICKLLEPDETLIRFDDRLFVFLCQRDLTGWQTDLTQAIAYVKIGDCIRAFTCGSNNPVVVHATHLHKKLAFSQDA